MASAKKLVFSDSYSEMRGRARPVMGTTATRRVGDAEAADRMAKLTGALESEVIPRLLLAHRATPSPGTPASSGRSTPPRSAAGATRPLGPWSRAFSPRSSS